MKSKVGYSAYATVQTVLLIGVFIVASIFAFPEKMVFWTLVTAFAVIIIFSLLYGALYVAATPDYIILGSPLRRKLIPMREVESVELFKPTMGAFRLCGSGGFMGYWGLFREGDIGRYYGFYGKASDCFLVRLKNGDKYVLGCQNPSAMLAYIQSQISK